MKTEKLMFQKYCLLFIIIIYIILNLVTLTRFPLMHSDESWLSGLSRHMLVTGDFSVTEPFFDLITRNQHALKTFFHTLQLLMIKTFGYTLFNIRLLSLLFGLVSLYYFYRLCLLMFPGKKLALWACLLMGVDIQFLYASHFGRQEIMLVWILVFGLYYYFKNITSRLYRHDIFLGFITGVSIGIHPNFLIIFLVFSGIYLIHFFEKKKQFTSFLIFSLTFAGLILFFITLSYRFDPNFLFNYLSYGQKQFKIFNPFSTKLFRLASYAKSIYLRQGGTYYLPDLKVQLLLLNALFLLSQTIPCRKTNIDRKSIPFWLIISVTSIIIGLLLIGRYNTTYIAFFIPFIYLLVGFCLTVLPDKFQKVAPVFLFLSLLFLTIHNVYPFLKYDYQSYLNKVTMAVEPNRKVLASLNVEYAFNDSCLFDLRNLSFLKQRGLTFAEYLRKNRIEYIIYPEGLDFIYQNRPKWNGVYGHLPYYIEMRHFIQEHCRLVSSFEDPAYGIEIPTYVGKKNWRILIYKVLY